MLLLGALCLNTKAKEKPMSTAINIKQLSNFETVQERSFNLAAYPVKVKVMRDKRRKHEGIVCGTFYNGENSFSSSVSFSDVHSYVRAAHDVMEHIMRHYMKLTVESAKETTPGVNV